MAGHSKWAQIKRKKALIDSRRGALFTRLVREITVAAKNNPDPDSNPRLRLAIQNARRANMPKDVIQRAIQKSQSAEGNIQEVTYEGYGPAGVAILVECMTDNTNRTVSTLRTLFTRAGGSLGTSGSVSYLFQRKGVFTLEQTEPPSENLILDLAEAGAEDVENQANLWIITCPYEAFGNVNQTLLHHQLEPQEATLSWIPTTTVSLEWEEAQKALRLIDQLEEHDDVQKVFHNLEMTEEIAAHYA
ncbi:MAG: YebC/PmpR family DNA-binding transcriptional regulator [Bacteroidia bacterium]